MSKKRIGTKIYEANEKLGIHKITDAVAKATGKKGDCGCKKRAEKLDKIHEKVSNMFQGNKKQD